MSRNSFPPKHTTIITFRLKTGQPPLSFAGLLHSGVIKDSRSIYAIHAHKPGRSLLVEHPIAERKASNHLFRLKRPKLDRSQRSGASGRTQPRTDRGPLNTITVPTGPAWRSRAHWTLPCRPSGRTRPRFARRPVGSEARVHAVMGVKSPGRQPLPVRILRQVAGVKGR